MWSGSEGVNAPQLIKGGQPEVNNSLSCQGQENSL